MSEPNAAETDLLRDGLHDLADTGGALDGERARPAVDAVLVRGRRARRTRQAGAVCAVALIVTSGSLAGLRLTGGDPHPPPTLSSPAPAPSTAPAPLPTRTFDFDHLQLGPRHPVVGARYPFDLTVHCGIRYAEFAGRSWRTDQTVPVPYPTPDPETHLTTEYGMMAGYLTVLTPTAIRFDAPRIPPVTFHAMPGQAPLCD